MQNIKKSRIIAIIGPTASGKSDLAIFLAQKISAKGGPASGWQGAEIISADSRQIYKGMDIGTGKVTKKEQRMARHHLIDIVSPKKEFTVADFKARAKRALEDIVKRGKIPVICGGTGLYIDALIYDLDFPEVPPNKKLRAQFDKLTVKKLFEKLKKLDPQRAKTIDPHNKYRVIRALEVIASIGKVPPLNTKYETHVSQYDVLWFGLNPKDLEKRIQKRLDTRLEKGMVSEVKKLHARGVSWKRLYNFGLEYRWISEYLQGKIGKKEMRICLQIAIRQYARRQMTWFRRNKKIYWLKNQSEAIRLTRTFLK